MFNLPANFLTSFLTSQFSSLPYPTTPFTNRTIIITGANTGLGFEAAKHFARLNASKIILGCRSLEAGLKAKSDIKAFQTKSGSRNISTEGGNKTEIEVWELNLLSYTSVQEFCKRCGTLPRIDVVILNAGVATPVFELVKENGVENEMEKTIVVNVISTFLMALLLVPTLRDSGGRWNMLPRIVVVGSDAHEQAKFPQQSSTPLIFPAFKSPNHQSDRYNTSKLLLILLVRSLAPLIKSSNIIINFPTPGFTKTSLFRSSTFPLSLLTPFGLLLIGRSSEAGSRTLLSAATGGEESHGCYMVDCKVAEPSLWVRSEKGKETQVRVWKEFGGLAEGICPGVMGGLRGEGVSK